MTTTNSQTSRERLLEAAKELFARFGYEQVTSAAIADAADTSESQINRHFGGKPGILQTIFEESWLPMVQQIQEIAVGSVSAREAILGTLRVVSDSLGKDPELSYLFLYEGRRIRGDNHEIIVSRGFRDFTGLLTRLIQRGQKDGTLAKDLNPEMLAAALIGAAENMLRENRGSSKRATVQSDIYRVFAAILAGCALPSTEVLIDMPAPQKVRMSKKRR